MARLSLYVCFFSTSRRFFVRFSDGKWRLSWFIISCLTAISNVLIVGSVFLGVKKLSFSLNGPNILGLWSDFPKWAFDFILLNKGSKSFSSAFLLKFGRWWQNLRPLLNILNAYNVNLCLLKLIIRPFGLPLSPQDFRSCFAKDRKLPLWPLKGFECPLLIHRFNC